MCVQYVLCRILGGTTFGCTCKASFELYRGLCKVGNCGNFIKWRLICTEIFSAFLLFPVDERAFVSSLYMRCFSFPRRLLRKRTETPFMISSLGVFILGAERWLEGWSLWPLWARHGGSRYCASRVWCKATEEIHEGTSSWCIPRYHCQLGNSQGTCFRLSGFGRHFYCSL